MDGICYVVFVVGTLYFVFGIPCDLLDFNFNLLEKFYDKKEEH